MYGKGRGIYSPRKLATRGGGNNFPQKSKKGEENGISKKNKKQRRKRKNGKEKREKKRGRKWHKNGRKKLEKKGIIKGGKNFNIFGGRGIISDFRENIYP